MKKTTVATLALSLCIVAFADVCLANDKRTVKGHIACFKEQWLYDIIYFRESGNSEDMSVYFKTKKCTILKGGLAVKVTKTPGLFGFIVGFDVDGVKLWTDTFGIE